MTGLRAPVLSALALAALAACTADAEPTAPPASPPADDAAGIAVVPTSLAPASGRTRRPAPGTERRPSLPPGVLSRAADAKALERAPECPPPAPAGPVECGPQPDRVEIEWDVAPER
jgi:hypothetical protein